MGQKLILIEKLPMVKVKCTGDPCGYWRIYNARYKCICGNEFTANCGNVKRGKTKSCGCVKRQCKSNYIDGRSKTRLNEIYLSMVQRVRNPNNADYLNYGGRGIKIYEEWSNDFTLFRAWAMSNGYKEKLSIDRINNDGDYTPNNCRWVTNKIQSINRRPKKNKTEFPGVSRTHNNKFRINITINNKKKNFGQFDTAEAASEVYQKAKKERDKLYFEEFKNNK